MILKIGQNGDYAKAVAFVKCAVWVKKLKLAKTCEKQLYNRIRAVLCKHGLKKAHFFGK